MIFFLKFLSKFCKTSKAPARQLNHWTSVRGKTVHSNTDFEIQILQVFSLPATLHSTTLQDKMQQAADMPSTSRDMRVFQ